LASMNGLLAGGRTALHGTASNDKCLRHAVRDLGPCWRA
jgi:hypothetical protein